MTVGVGVTDIDGRAIDLMATRQKPFHPTEVNFRLADRKARNGSVRAFTVVNPRALVERLDESFGHWSMFNRDPIYAEGVGWTVNVELWAGGVSKASFGTGHDSKSAEANALFRAATYYGIGTYLYSMPDIWVSEGEYAETDRGMYLPANTVEKLRQQYANHFKPRAEHQLVGQDAPRELPIISGSHGVFDAIASADYTDEAYYRAVVAKLTGGDEAASDDNATIYWALSQPDRNAALKRLVEQLVQANRTTLDEAEKTVQNAGTEAGAQQ